MPSEPGLIEFLVPDERAFGPAEGGSVGGSGAGTTFVGFDGDLWDDQPERSPRTRWLSILTGIAVTGLVVSGVVAAAPWTEDDAAVTPPTVADQTASNPTTLAATPDAPVDPSRTGWVLDPVPLGMRPTSLARSVNLRPDESGWGEVWASPGATRVSGRWFSLTLQPFVAFASRRPELWFTVDVAGRPGHARVAADGVVSLSFDAGQTDNSRLVTIDAYGIGLDAMIALADSISIIDDRPQMVDDRPEFNRPELLDGLDRIAAAPTDVDLTTSAILGGTRRTMALYSGPGPLDLTLVQEQTPDLTSSRGDITTLMSLAFTSVPLADGWGPKGDFAGHNLVVGHRTLDDLDLTVARWLDGETELSLLTTGDLGDLLQMLPHVNLASAEDWAAAERSLDTDPRADEPSPRTPPEITVGAGVLADGTTWSVTYWHSSGEWEVRVGGSTFSTPRPPPTTAMPVTVGGVTLLAVHTDVAGAAAVITTIDGSSTQMTLAATDPADQASLMGVMPIESTLGSPIESTLAFTVDVTAADGTVVHRFAPWDPEPENRSAPGSGLDG